MKITFLDTNETIEVVNSQQLHKTKAGWLNPDQMESLKSLGVQLGYEVWNRNTDFKRFKHVMFFDDNYVDTATADDFEYFKEYREFILVSPTPQDPDQSLINQWKSAQWPERFVTEFDKANPEPPIWYTAQEMEAYLKRQNYSADIAKELSESLAASLQAAFRKGWDKCLLHHGLLDINREEPANIPAEYLPTPPKTLNN